MNVVLIAIVYSNSEGTKIHGIFTLARPLWFSLLSWRRHRIACSTLEEDINDIWWLSDWDPLSQVLKVLFVIFLRWKSTRKARPAKISRSYQNFAFQLFNFKWHFPTDTFFTMEALRDFWRAWQGCMKQQLKVFSPTYGQLTHSIVLSEFGLLTILSKIVLRMCRFCARNFALQGINLKFSIHRILRFKGIRTHSELHCETCPRCP